MGTEDDPDISGLPSNLIYYKLDNASNDYINHENHFWKTAIKNHHMKNLTIFDSLAKGSLYISSLDNEDIFYDQRWNYLYFWAGSKVLESSESSSFYDTMHLINTVKSYIDKTNKYNDEMLKINTDKFKELKEIYDYFQNYESIKAKISPINPDCTLPFKEYVEKSYNTYNDMNGKCAGNHEDDHCKIFHSFVSKYKMKDITKLTCNGTKVPQLQDQMDYTEYAHDLERNLPSRGQSPQMPPASRGLHPSPGSTNAISTVLPLLGTVSILFVWFKFSPLGSWLYNSIFKKKFIGKYEQEEEPEILEYPYSFAHRNVADSAHNIAYHTT
ncbi:PIR Superfamily Protein [Plasmodium ovale curtisi]|uniref:PIR Superfamily Protein n=1 Tax=Plasmodium ovale curtisi TaxID=864141 RepID=A0A1A8W874_PLAOA|nr:PIR Superfamily Protein [Plasmodium ovale curtisi]SBT00147.1 PIR Superfamily Protein [Plasmodium ovale curtisi]